MQSLKIKGNRRLWVLFHGTGGDDTSLLYITGEIDPQASLLAYQGQVGKGQERRFFKPLENGKLNKEDFEGRVRDFLQDWQQTKWDEYDEIYGLGYSNGANFLIGITQSHPDLFDKVFLLHPANLGWPAQGPSPNQEWLITLGALDQMSPAGPIYQWVKSLPQDQQDRVTIKLLDAYHGVTDPEIEWLQTQVSSLI